MKPYHTSRSRNMPHLPFGLRARTESRCLWKQPEPPRLALPEKDLKVILRLVHATTHSTLLSQTIAPCFTGTVLHEALIG